MSNRRMNILAGATGLAVGITLAVQPWASAGHVNTVLFTTLDGRAEVVTNAPDNRIVGDPDGAGEVYVFGIDGDPSTLCYVLVVAGIADLDLAPGAPRAAHIHEAPAGVNGPVEVNLAWPQGGQAADCLTEGEAGKGLDPGEVAEILANPENFYVNVHNGGFPGGALRGQLETQH